MHSVSLENLVADCSMIKPREYKYLRGFLLDIGVYNKDVISLFIASADPGDWALKSTQIPATSL